MSTQSVLDEMTAGVMGHKQEKAAILTPVGLEKGGPLTHVVTQAPFPNDHPVEVINQAVRAIRREIASIVAALDAIDATTETGRTDDVVIPDSAAVTKAKERNADATAAKARTVTTPETEAVIERMAKLKAKAQADTFTGPTMQEASDRQIASAGRLADAVVSAVLESHAAQALVAGSWVCPAHGSMDLKQLTSRKMRVYMACCVKGCQEFEK